MKKLLIIILFTFSNVLLGQDLTEGLLIHYTLDGNAIDISDNSYHGTIFGVTFGDDRFGNSNSAAYFDGINDYIEFPNISELKPDLPVSFSFLVKYDDITYENSTVFNTSFEEDVNSGLYMNVQSSTSRYQISFGDGSNYYSPASRRTYTNNSSIIPDKWYHLIIVVNSELNMNIYVDGIESGGSYSGSGNSLQYSDFPGNLGRHDRSLTDPADYFKGVLDDFRYWNRELTNEEIMDLFDTLDLNEFEHNSITIYPNPTHNLFHFKSDIESIDFLNIYNSLGQKVISTKFKSTLSLGHLSKGLYFIEFIKDSFIERKKLIIN